MPSEYMRDYLNLGKQTVVPVDDKCCGGIFWFSGVLTCEAVDIDSLLLEDEQPTIPVPQPLLADKDTA